MATLKPKQVATFTEIRRCREKKEILLIIPAKKQVYLNEFNILMEKTVYLPLVSGMLTASSLVLC